MPGLLGDCGTYRANRGRYVYVVFHAEHLFLRITCGIQNPKIPVMQSSFKAENSASASWTFSQGPLGHDWSL